MINFIQPFILSSSLTIIGIYITIQLFSRYSLSQAIRTDGPKSHLQKRGTPTMGGIAIILSVTIATILTSHGQIPSEIKICLILPILCGILGLIDDALKLLQTQICVWKEKPFHRTINL